jgi:hypothetical protein
MKSKKTKNKNKKTKNKNKNKVIEGNSRTYTRVFVCCRPPIPSRAADRTVPDSSSDFSYLTHCVSTYKRACILSSALHTPSRGCVLKAWGEQMRADEKRRIRGRQDGADEKRRAVADRDKK